MLTEEQFNKWIEALRSGNYKQGRYNLKTEANCYCCLGVLADIIDPNGWKFISEAEYWNTEIYHNQYKFIWKSKTEDLPDDIISIYSQSQLTDLNDIKKYSFNEIADYLEENKGDFVKVN